VGFPSRPITNTPQALGSQRVEVTYRHSGARGGYEFFLGEQIIGRLTLEESDDRTGGEPQEWRCRYKLPEWSGWKSVALTGEMGISEAILEAKAWLARLLTSDAAAAEQDLESDENH
jgi:hypothetical protein